MKWDPTRYGAFSGERGRPAAELVERMLAVAPSGFAPETIVDLGCGTGALLLSLGERWPQATLVGVDNSREMLAEACRGDRAGRARWVEADVGTWQPDAPVPLLVSNACLQWLPDHARLIPRLVDAVAPGGMLAVQMPSNFEAPSHTIARALAAEAPFAAVLGGVNGPLGVLPAAAYHRLVAAHGGVELIDVWETEYLHVLGGDDPVVGWVRGTTLLPIQGALEAADPTLAARFLDAYRARVADAYPREPDGTTLFPFKRLFFVLRKSPARSQ